MREQEKQDNFLNVVGKDNAMKLQKIWDNSYPRFCSIPYGEELPINHTKEEVFNAKAGEEGFSEGHINLFLNL